MACFYVFAIKCLVGGSVFLYWSQSVNHHSCEYYKVAEFIKLMIINWDHYNKHSMFSTVL